MRIGDDIWVTLLKTEGGQASIGFEAPRDVLILRESLINRDRDASRPGEGGGPGR